MILTKSTVEKIAITGVPNMDAIAVMCEDFGTGQGKITITCFNDCWSNYWSAMGSRNIKEFFLDCSNDYLTGKQFTVADMVAQTQGVICRKDKDVIDEIPGAYKDIDQVMANQADLTEILHTLKQVVCVKG